MSCHYITEYVASKFDLILLLKLQYHILKALIDILDVIEKKSKKEESKILKQTQ